MYHSQVCNSFSVHKELVRHTVASCWVNLGTQTQAYYAVRFESFQRNPYEKCLESQVNEKQKQKTNPLPFAQSNTGIG